MLVIARLSSSSITDGALYFGTVMLRLRLNFRGDRMRSLYRMGSFGRRRNSIVSFMHTGHWHSILRDSDAHIYCHVSTNA